jgi:regulatory protein
MTATDPVDLAARALAHRDRSRVEVEERLARAGVSEEERGEALDTLERLGYLDDSRFARTRAEALAARGYGDAYIRHDLEQKGVSGETSDDAIGSLEAESDRARALAARLGSTPKTVAQLARKGFDRDSLQGLADREGRDSWPFGHDL